VTPDERVLISRNAHAGRVVHAMLGTRVGGAADAVTDRRAAR
jgi:hypothetical protein